MSARKLSRRDVLKAAGLTVGVAAGGSMSTSPAHASTLAPQDAETLTNYGSHIDNGRSMTITSITGQQLKITAYGDYIVRVHSKRSGETFFADDRYEMVDPANHAGMVGTLSIVDNGASFAITTAAADGIEVILQKNPLRVEFYDKADRTLLAKEDSTHS